MTYVYQPLNKPTRLYIKSCSHCGLKYFGKSIRPNVADYKGSGVRWRRHLANHNAKADHLWNSEWYNDTSIARFATKFSRINKIVTSSKWANLCEEDGLSGGNTLSSKSAEELYEINEKKKTSCRSRYGVDHFTQLEEIKEQYSKMFTGRQFSDETRLKMSNAKIGVYDGNKNPNFGKRWSDDQKKASSVLRKSRGLSKGEKNSMFGKTREDLAARNKLPKAWVTNGVEDRLILREDFDSYIASGYRKGRSKAFG